MYVLLSHKNYLNRNLLTHNLFFIGLFVLHYTQVPDAPFLIVGTKTDLRNDAEVQNKVGDTLSTEDGHDLAKLLGGKGYVECSALTQEGLKNVFDEAIRAAMHKGQRGKKKRCVLL